jgi:hypothetical protein
MAVVVSLAIIIRDELKSIALGQMFRVLLHEPLGAFPERGDRLNVLVQTDDKTVLLVVLGHELKDVIVDVTEELNAGLDAPVPLVLKHERVAEEKTTFVSAHVTVALGITIDDLALKHILTNVGGLLLVDPIGVGPMFLRNQAVPSFSRDQAGGDLLESIIKFVVVQENPVVVVAAVESVLNLTNGASNLPDVRVASKRDESRVHPLSRCGLSELFMALGRIRRRLRARLNLVRSVLDRWVRYERIFIPAVRQASGTAAPFRTLVLEDLARGLKTRGGRVGGGGNVEDQDDGLLNGKVSFRSAASSRRRPAAGQRTMKANTM